MNVNIGGGRGWNYPGWRNFDGAEGFPLTPQTVFPIEDESAPIVYSSHCFEHLDDATVDRMLTEARRMLAPDGRLVLKLPDFEQVLERWRAGDERYFDQWGMKDVIPTWERMGVKPTIDAKAAFIFCGWWNDAYGDEFGERHPERAGAYHGPVPASALVGAYSVILAGGRIPVSPHEISSRFRNFAPSGGHFNHRNAWSREQMWASLFAHGFVYAPYDYAWNVPGDLDQFEISAYFYATTT